jgi:hypothetical protein
MVSGSGIAISIINSQKEGYRVVIERPDGSTDFRKVSGEEDGVRVISDIVDGQFKKTAVAIAPAVNDYDTNCTVCGVGFKRQTWNQKYCEEHRSR